MKQSIRSLACRHCLTTAAAFFLCAMVAALASHASDSKGSAPSIAFEKTSHDFGKQPQNTALKHTFTFRNTGDATLIIEKVKST